MTATKTNPRKNRKGFPPPPADAANAGPKRYAISDGSLLLNLETEGKRYIVTSPLDPELVTQARTIEEAFRKAYAAKKLLEKQRGELERKANARRNPSRV